MFQALSGKEKFGGGDFVGFSKMKTWTGRALACNKSEFVVDFEDRTSPHENLEVIHWTFVNMGFRYSVVREEEDEDSYLLVHIPNKAMRYNFKDKSFEKVHELAPVGIKIEVVSTLEYRGSHAFQYTESLAYV
ncbi:hypothetical protein Q3G72_004955 [Acer saccharum]|nr:hypothetical protein Q3G72_004955 [Acer saccharum]